MEFYKKNKKSVNQILEGIENKENETQELLKLKKEHRKNFTISFYKDSPISSIIDELKLVTGNTKKSIIIDALIYYKCFINKVMKDDKKTEILQGKSP